VSTDARRREIGETDAPVEDEINESFHQIVSEGSQRLHRTWRTVLVTGTFGGMEIGVGVMAYLAVEHETGNRLLAGLAFGIGFMALLLAKSELFTENFLVPITAVMAGEGRWRDLLRLYGATLVANLVSGWLFMWLVVLAFPQWHAILTESAVHFVSAPLGAESICLAVLGGSTITLMTRMQHGTQSDVAKVVAGFAGGFLLAGLQLFHSVLDSLLIFGAIHAGAPIGYGSWLAWFAYTVVFNVLGGLLLVTALRLVRTKELLEQHRAEVRDSANHAA
jgi:formate/nitrite transporter FocA (FNT family)